MPALDYMKVDAPTQFPSMCICGSQKGPLVDTFLDKRGYGGSMEGGRIYLCSLCVKRAARALGFIKGDEMDRLENAAAELAQAQKEIDDRQQIIDRMTKTAGEREARLQTLNEYIETLQGDLALRKMQANQVLATVKEMTAA